jgi:hypothetical protein
MSAIQYSLAIRPERHNGGVFFEHEICILLADRFQGNVLASQRAKEILDGLGNKHEDYRMKVQSVRVYEDKDHIGAPWTSAAGWRPVKYQTQLIVRFRDKNHALRFKLAWV